MDVPKQPFHTEADLLVLANLAHDIDSASQSSEAPSPSSASPAHDDKVTVAKLAGMNDEASPAFQPTIFSMWDTKDLSPTFRKLVVQPYVTWASGIVRRKVDVVFLTHILFYSFTVLPSALYLFHNFTYVHAVLHSIFAIWCAGAWTLMLHNHLHQNGILAKPYALFDYCFPFVLGPLMGHTWNSYYFHHVKMHHAEGNGPDDLSSTIRYQRDELWDFLCYEGRFLAFVWIELPNYFIRRRKYRLALFSFLSETSCLGTIGYAVHVYGKPAVFALVIPLAFMRVGMMVGNWGQHCFVDDVEPKSDYRSSITLIDEAVSIRWCRPCYVS